MKKIAICVATCDRNDMLDKCLASLIAASQMVGGYEVFIVVVDNNSTPQAMNVVDKYSSHNISYQWEKTPGIPFARNACLDVALEKNADFISFVDDDEVAEVDWLKRIVNSIDRDGVDVVSGQVIQLGKESTIKFSGQSELSDRASTDNVIFKRWLASKYRFDERFAQTGGSDTLFFRQAFQDGAVIKSCRDAIVYEMFPSSRTSLGWLMQRHFRYGMINCKIEKSLKNGQSSYLLFLKGIVLLPLGVVEAMLRFCIKGKKGFRQGLCRVMRGVGTIAFFLGIKYDEYKR